MIRVRVPAWALADGMPPPGEDEGFDSYWRRMGVDEETLTVVQAGLTERTEDVANERMGAYLRGKMPDAFDRHVDLMQRCTARRPTG